MQKLRCYGVAVLLAVGLLSGCKTTRTSYELPPDDTEYKLAEAAAAISQSLVKLQAMEQATTPMAKQILNPTPQQISGQVTIDWSGAIEPLLQQVAVSSGYRLRVIGRTPAVPVLITLNVHDVPLAEVLRDVDFQAGAKASVRVFSAQRVIELKYT